MPSFAGVPTLEVGSPQLYSLPEFDTHQSRALHALMDIIRRQRGRFIPLQVSSHVVESKGLLNYVHSSCLLRERALSNASKPLQLF